MDLNTFIQIQDVAKSTRSWVEHIIENSNDDYPEDAMGLCAVASAKLFLDLKKEGFKPIIAAMTDMDGDHCFVELPSENILVDVTATQFGMKKIEIHSITADIRRHFFWSTIGRKTFKGVKTFAQWCTKTDWPLEQNPKSFIKV